MKYKIKLQPQVWDQFSDQLRNQLSCYEIDYQVHAQFAVQFNHLNQIYNCIWIQIHDHTKDRFNDSD